MPTSFVGLLLFVALLAPGMTFRWRRTARQPVQKVSELREVAAAVLISGLCDAGALSLFGLLRAVRPAMTLDAGRLVREGSTYFKDVYVAALSWLTVLMLIACGLALALAAAADRAAIDGSWINKITRWVRADRPEDVTTEPAWWCMFANRSDEYVYAGCELDDGTYIGGYVYKFSAESDETADRELVLTKPQLRDADGTLTDLGSSAAVVSARHLQYLTVTYVQKTADSAT